MQSTRCAGNPSMKQNHQVFTQIKSEHFSNARSRPAFRGNRLSKLGTRPFVKLGASLGGLLNVAIPLPAAAAVVPHPVIGMYRSVRVRRGDTMLKIARRFAVNADVMASANHVHGGALRPGQRLTLPTLHILPATPSEGIVLNIPARQVYLFRAGRCIATYPAAVGQPSWPTATGNYTLANRVVNPQWKPTRTMVERAPIQDDVVPPGPDNPVGDRWMGWSLKGFGFHSTTAPATVGRAASHGCVRLYPESAHRMFDLVTKGEAIQSLYMPVLLGRRGGRYYLTVFPDVYSKGGVSLEDAKAVIEQSVPLTSVDMREVADIVQAHEGYPRQLHVGIRRPDNAGRSAPRPSRFRKR